MNRTSVIVVTLGLKLQYDLSQIATMFPNVVELRIAYVSGLIIPHDFSFLKISFY